MDFYLSSNSESKIEKPAGVPFCGEVKPVFGFWFGWAFQH
jgi:hypothetical protein